MQLALHGPSCSTVSSDSLRESTRERTVDDKSHSYWSAHCLRNCIKQRIYMKNNGKRFGKNEPKLADFIIPRSNINKQSLELFSSLVLRKN